MTEQPVDIVGMGVAGLSAALCLTDAGIPVRLWEAAPQAGGRCRSLTDSDFGELDTGTHLVLSGNRAVSRYLARCDSAAELPSAPPVFHFAAVDNGRKWHLDLRNPLHLLPLLPDCLRLLRAAPDTPVAAVLRHSRNWQRLWRPLALAALNTDPETAAAAGLKKLLTECLLRGYRACRPRLPRTSLGAAFITPALARLPPVHYRSRLSGISLVDGKIAALQFTDGRWSESGRLILATPPADVARLLPQITPLPDEFSPILNLHFRLPAPRPALFLGLTGGTAEWLMVKEGLASVTISAAEHLLDQPEKILAATVWGEVAPLLSLPPEMIPPVRIIREKRATHLATAAQEARRPPAGLLAAQNIFLAGDWTATGLPATLESAIRSGETAAACILAPG